MRGLVLTLLPLAACAPLPEARPREVAPANAAGRWDGASIASERVRQTWSVIGDDSGETIALAAAVGDFNCDGFDDLASGRRQYSGMYLYVYHGGPDGLADEHDSEIEGDEYDGLGSALSVGDANGDGCADLLLGRPGGDKTYGSEGIADLYLGAAAGFGTAAWTLYGSTGDLELGTAVAFVGDVDADGYDDAMIGAPAYEGGAEGEGIAWLYRGTSTGLSTRSSWSEEGGIEGAAFGSAFAGGDFDADGYGDVAVAAPGYDDGADGQGLVRVWRGKSGGLQATASWSFGEGGEDAAFGTSLSTGDIDGDAVDDLVVGAPGWSATAGSDEGAVFAWLGGAGGLGRTAAKTWAGVPGDEAGWVHVHDLDGDGVSDILIGAPGDATSGVSDGGAVSVWFAGEDSPSWRFSSVARLGDGGTMLSAGDFDGNGAVDLVYGTPSWDNGSDSDAGRLDVIPGLAPGVWFPAWTWQVLGANYGLGDHTIVADLDGDGTDDILADHSSELLAWLGGDGGYGDDPTLTWTETYAFGWGYAFTVGDRDGDGFGDLVVSEPNRSSGSSYYGGLKLYTGGPDGPDSTADWSWIGTWKAAYMGRSALFVGDADGDGLDDLIAGGTGYKDTYFAEGVLAGFYGAPELPGTAADWSTFGGATSAALGTTLGAPGDVDGDGYDDFAASAPTQSASTTSDGQVRVWYGSAVGWASTADWTHDGGTASVVYGETLDHVGDVDGDGFDDLVVGGPSWKSGGVYGRVQLFFGSAAGLPAAPDLTWTGGATDAGFGSAVAAGDVDGDTIPDLLIGADEQDTSTLAPGSVFLYPGSGGRTFAVTPSIELAGSDPSSQFGVRVFAGVRSSMDREPQVLVVASTRPSGQSTGEYGALYEVDLADRDGDGWRGADDCDDRDPAVYPGAPDACDDIDQNCDGRVAESATAWFVDADGDGYGDAATTTRACTAPLGTVATSGDCDDTRAAISPSATESCNDLDDDCDGAVDEGVTSVFYADDDRDGFGNADHVIDACALVPGLSTDTTDCDDRDGAVFPGATEVCDGVDDDCDGTADDGASAGPWYEDADGDGLGTGIPTVTCPGPVGWVTVGGDCDDDDASVRECVDDGGDTGGDSGGDTGSVGDGSDARWEGATSATERIVPTWSVTASNADDDLAAAAALGDFDADGDADLVLALDDNTALFVYDGAPGGLPDTASGSRSLPATVSHTRMGATAVGDFDGDGYPDLALGVYGDVVWVYAGGPGGLAEAPYWYAEGDASSAAFGTALANAGDLDGDGYDDLVVGAPGYGSVETGEGAIFVYRGGAAGLRSAPSWVLTSRAADAGLGAAVAAGDVDGDEVLVWAGTAEGFAVLPSWSLTGAGLGTEVAVGDLDDDGVADLVAGDATNLQWFLGGADAWSAGAAGSVPGTVAELVDVDGDGLVDLLAGDPGVDGGIGGVTAWPGTSAGPTSPALLTWSVRAEGAATGTRLRHGDVDADGDIDVLVTSPDWANSYSSSYLGRVDVLVGQPGGPRPTLDDWSYDGASYTGRIGSSLSTGDVDGDGYDDLIAQHAYGSASGFRGGSSGFGVTPDWVWTTPSGYVTASTGVGDLDGDGVDDIVQASYDTHYAPLLTWDRGGPAGPDDSPDWSYATAGGSYSVAYFNVSADGDLDGDGSDDLVASRGYCTVVYTSEGCVDIWYGGTTGPAAVADLTLTGGATSAGLGYTLETAGDFDGDGYQDLVAAAATQDTTEETAGQVRLYLGGATGVASTPIWTVDGDQRDEYYGWALATLGDADGDGVDDLAISTHRYYADDHHGRADVYCGGTSGPATTPDFTALNPGDGREFGYGVSGGDVDGDGLADLVVQAEDMATSAPEVGSILIFPGVRGGVFDPTPRWEISANNSHGIYGKAVLIGGHWNDLAAPSLVVSEVTVSTTTVMGGRLHLLHLTDADGDGVVGYDDCDDTDAAVYPGAVEACDGIDNDCDGRTDEDAPSAYADIDGDGYGDPDTRIADCGSSGAFVDNPDDCDDADASVHPGVAEDCDDVDQDCDGEVDDGATGATLRYVDDDRDGYGDPARSLTTCGTAAGTSATGTDCDDTDAAAHPGGLEACGGGDEDCDGVVDEAGAIGEASTLADDDGDGWGDAARASVGCDVGTVLPGDCDDADASVHPGATEACDGSDQDCDGVADEGLTGTTWADDDGDGWGDTTRPLDGCVTGGAVVAGDCDDDDSTVSPDAVEVCDGVDQDCDGAADEGLTAVVYADADGDGYGAGASSVVCAVSDGWSSFGDDCDDTDATVHPAAGESCDGRDDDCDGSIDDGLAYADWYADLDGDGHGTGPAVSACVAPAGAVATSDDCDDADGAVFPGAIETCDGVDDDCDGTVDVGATDAETWYADADGDGFGNARAVSTACAAPAGTVADASDCDDGQPAAHPGASEVWYDGIDEACDGGDDFDQDGDGADAAAYAGTDCDDTDPTRDDPCADTGVPDDTDTGSPPDGDSDSGPGEIVGPVDTGGKDTPGGCGCETGASARLAAILPLLALLAARRRQGGGSRSS